MKQKTGIFVSKIAKKSLFDDSELTEGCEILVVNDHRVRSARKGADLVKNCSSWLTVMASKGSRPEDSDMSMFRVEEEQWNCIRFKTTNGLVRITDKSGPFKKSPFMNGDICLAINGIAVNDAHKAMEIVSEDTPGLIVVLSFSLRKLQRKLVESLLYGSLQIQWDDKRNECKLSNSSPANALCTLRFRDDGLCEGAPISADGIDPNIKCDIDAFVLFFNSRFRSHTAALRRVIAASLDKNKT